MDMTNSRAHVLSFKAVNFMAVVPASLVENKYRTVLWVLQWKHYEDAQSKKSKGCVMLAIPSARCGNAILRH